MPFAGYLLHVTVAGFTFALFYETGNAILCSILATLRSSATSYSALVLIFKPLPVLEAAFIITEIVNSEYNGTQILRIVMFLSGFILMILIICVLSSFGSRCKKS